MSCFIKHLEHQFTGTSLAPRTFHQLAVRRIKSLIAISRVRFASGRGLGLLSALYCETSGGRRIMGFLAARVILLVVVLVNAGPVLAAGPGRPDGGLPATTGGQPSEEVRLSVGYLKGYFSDTRDIITSPVAWRSSDWLKFLLIAGAALTFAQEEDDLQHWMQDNRSDDSNMVADITEPLGNGKYAIPALGALYCYGRLFGDDRARRTGLLSIESVVISGALTGTIKYLSHKHRPGALQADGIPWEGPGLSTAHLSFPSGHSACAFAIGTVVASEYGDNTLVPPLAYAAAALCAWSRLHDNEHWVSDVIIGSAIGHFTGRAVVGLHGGSREGGFSLVPAVNETGAGLSLSYKF